MKILQKFEEMAEGKSRSIGIGVGTSEFHNRKILLAILNFLEEHSSKIYIFGREESLNYIGEQITSKHKSNIFLIHSEVPENEIFRLLLNNTINCVIRGSLSSSKFLENLKKQLKTDLINRLALLETVDGHQFFYGPVGIDECNNVEEKIEFLENAIKELKLLNIKPNISVLSGGRLGDVGRDKNIDLSIKIGKKT
ncbi:MAG: hypothetical protein ACFFG0_50775, partial [Candidatus Thorarchaeota archaeon]